MSNYIYTNGELHNADELMHYGVLGMKWGKRKTVSVHKGLKNARKAKRDAYMDSAKASGAKKIGPLVAHPNLKSKFNARKAGNEAFKESIKNDKAHNKQVRADKKTPNPNKKREIAIAAGAAAATALAAYGTYKLSKAIKDKHFREMSKSGMSYIKHKSERGFWDSDFDYIKDVFNDGHNMGVRDIVKYHIGNNEVNGKVDWKNVYKRVKPW